MIWLWGWKDNFGPCGRDKSCVCSNNMPHHTSHDHNRGTSTLTVFFYVQTFQDILNLYKGTDDPWTSWLDCLGRSVVTRDTLLAPTAISVFALTKGSSGHGIQHQARMPTVKDKESPFRSQGSLQLGNSTKAHWPMRPASKSLDQNRQNSKPNKPCWLNQHCYSVIQI